MEDFLEGLAEILDVDEVSATDVFEEFEDWDSLAVLSVVATIDSMFGVNLSSAETRGAATPQDLLALVEAKGGRTP